MKVAVTILVSCVAGLLALGMVMLYSCSMAKGDARYLSMQLVWGGVGLVFCLFAACMDYGTLKKVPWPLLGVAVLLLILVFVPHIGARVNGASRWIRIGGFQ